MEQVPEGARKAVFRELTALWLVTLLSIKAVVMIAESGLPKTAHDLVLAAVPFLFIYVPVYLCKRRGVDSYEYRLAVPAFSDHAAWREAFVLVAKIVGAIVVPWLIGYHLYQTTFFHVSPARCLPADWKSWLPVDHSHKACLPDDWYLLVPYHLFYVAIPEEFFYRGYVQTRLNEVFPRKFLIFGTPVGWGLPIACLYFAFGHSLVTVRWWHFATFFPGLVFGWLRERTGHPLAGALFHAWANVTVGFLDRLYGIV